MHRHVWVCTIRFPIPAVLMEQSEVAGCLCSAAAECLSESHQLAGRGPWELGQCLPSCGLGLGLGLWRLASDWTVRGLNPGAGKRLFLPLPFQTSRWGHLAFCLVRTGGKAAGARLDL